MSEMQKRNLYHYKNSSSKRIHIKYFKLGKNTVQFLCACLWPWLGIKVIQNSINIFFSSIFLTNIILFCPQNIQQRIHVKKTSMNPPSNSNIALTSEGQGWQMWEGKYAKYVCCRLHIELITVGRLHSSQIAFNWYTGIALISFINYCKVMSRSRSLQGQCEEYVTK